MLDRFDIFEFDYYMYYNGRRLITHNTSYMEPFTKYAWMTGIYMDPFVSRKIDVLNLTVYEKCRSGLMAINIANNVFWIAVSSAAGLFIFRKREFN